MNITTRVVIGAMALAAAGCGYVMLVAFPAIEDAPSRYVMASGGALMVACACLFGICAAFFGGR